MEFYAFHTSPGLTVDMSKDFLGRAALKKAGSFEDVDRRIMPLSLEYKLE